jgi:hypothetical protein
MRSKAAEADWVRLRPTEQIVLAHANLPTITQCYDQLNQLIASRNLQTVTLNDVFA